MFDNHYIDWRNKRFNFILNYYGENYFNNKTILELGAGYGDLGGMFIKYGAIVTSVEARSEHIKEGQIRNPNNKFILKNLEEDFTDLINYDIILDTGLFYHLSNPEKHIEYLSKIIKTDLIFETECNNSINNISISNKENKESYDQSFIGSGNQSSRLYIENLFDKYNINFEIHNNPKLNSVCHIYDWEESDRNDFSDGHRRFWICKNK